jgi:hypothetical protein
MKEEQMVQYWFEIFRRTYDRWSWHFVEVRDGERRVLARSGRDYRSRRRARRAIRALKRAVRGAQVVVPGGNGQEGFPLPASSFALVPGVVPLMVGGPPIEYDPAEARRRERAGGASSAELRTQTGELIQVRELPPRPAVQQEVAEATTPEPPAASEKKPTPRRGGRKPRGT